MSKSTQTAVVTGKRTASMTTKTLTYCALLAALSVAMARLFGLMPNEYSRFSIESIPTFLAGVLFGPIAGGLVGFVSDFVGCLFSGYGYNPMFCLPPILCGVCGGLFQGFLAKKVSILRLFAAYAVPVVFGSILWQSFALDFVYDMGFLLLLSTRSIQFAITLVINVVIVNLLFRTKMFVHMGVWPPKRGKKEAAKDPWEQ